MNEQRYARGMRIESPEIRKAMSMLAQRAAQVRLIGIAAVLVGVVFANGAWFAGHLAAALAPTTALSSIHVPAKVVRALEDRLPQPGVRRDGIQTRSLPASAGDVLDEFSKIFISTLGLALAAGLAIVAALCLGGLLSVTAGITVATTFMMVSTTGFFLLAEQRASQGPSPHQRAPRHQEARSHAFLDDRSLGIGLTVAGLPGVLEEALRDMSGSAGDVHLPYVRWQVDLLKHQAGLAPLADINTRSIEALAAELTAGKDLDVSGRWLYALEMSHLGKASSPQAKAYLQQAGAGVERWTTAENILTGAAWVLVLFGLPTLVVGLPMRVNGKKLDELV